ncbi:MAG: hypothetical protein WBP09_06820, partial [Propionicimonas sp.]
TGAGGVSLSAIYPPPGDGLSGATAKGASGGVGDFAFPTARLESSSSVTVAVNASSISAGGDLKVEALSESTQTTYADTTGGGALSVGEAHADTLTGQGAGNAVVTSVTIGTGTVLTASDDLTVTADSDHVVSATAKSRGGGAISGKIAETTAKLTFTTTVTVNGTAKLTAGDALQVQALSTSDVQTSTDTYSVGVGAGADSDNTNDDHGAYINATTTVTVNNGAIITGRSVALNALVVKMVGKASASAVAYSPILLGVASAFANAKVQIDSQATVDINGAATRIKGLSGVEIRAVHSGLTVVRDAYSLAVALIPPQDSYEEGSTTLNNDVTSDAGGLVTAGVRDNARLAETGLVNGTTQGISQSSPALALYVDAHNQTTTSLSGSSDGVITWGADVTILGGRGGAPELVIDASGQIKVLRNVTVRDDVASAALAVGATISDGDYYVSVSNDGFGDVAFVSDTNQNPAGAMPLFTFRDNLESVLILDHSSQEMHITGIDVIYRGTDVPLVQFIRRSLSSTVVAQGTTTMQFDLWRNLTPEGGSVDVQKIQRDGDVRRSDADIVVDGSIINPIGWTRILTTDGDIRSGSNSAWIETNVADLEATRGSVGDAAAARLHVRLVQSINRGDRPATSDDTLRTVRLFVTAGVDTYLYLQAADRVNPTSSPLPTTALPVGIDAVVAGRHADLVLADSVRQEGTSLVAETRVRVDKEPHDQNYSSHFRPDGADSYRDPAAYLGTDSVSIDSTWTFERTASLAVRVLGTHPLTGLAAFGLNRTLTPFGTAGTPGITAGTPDADGNIIVADVQGDANWTTSG